MNKITHGSLFTGIGGFDLAAKQNKIENIFQVEINYFCQKVLEKNFPNVKKYKNIKEFNGTEYRGAIDIISGGFPCQDISISGTGKGLQGERSGLWFEFQRIIKEIQPKFVIIENSPNLLNKGFNIILKGLSESGYDAEWDCLQADWFNGHHKRRRLFIIAYTMQFRLDKKSFFDRFYQEIISKKMLHDRFDNVLFQTKQDRFEFVTGHLRKNNDVSQKLDKIQIERIKALGNAVVPKISKIIFKIIKDILEEK